MPRILEIKDLEYCGQGAHKCGNVIIDDLDGGRFAFYLIADNGWGKRLLVGDEAMIEKALNAYLWGWLPLRATDSADNFKEEVDRYILSERGR